ncbi:hypothetical protein Y032_0573g157 [Ancylostoma ceylanicum]|nr:hypothetical protein Y032_0573g157 [Ancylostoma ceylanicum]
MPSKTGRSNKKNESISLSQIPSISENNSQGIKTINDVSDEDVDKMSMIDLITYIKGKVNDPSVEHLLEKLSEKVPKEISREVEAEKRARTVVISGIEEPAEGLRATERSRDLKAKVDEILDALDIDCNVSDVFRIGKPNGNRPRLVKLVFPSTFYWKKALANARLLRNAGFRGVFIRKSLTEEERRHEYELRQLARERNNGKAEREWVVYRSQLKHVSELPNRRPVNY